MVSTTSDGQPSPPIVMLKRRSVSAVSCGTIFFNAGPAASDQKNMCPNHSATATRCRMTRTW
jgi:hypothetical protein